MLSAHETLYHQKDPGFSLIELTILSRPSGVRVEKKSKKYPEKTQKPDFLYFHYNPRLQCSNNMCASVFQHIFTALALQLHCSSDKDSKYVLDIFSLQFVRLQLEMKSKIQSFSPFAYNLSSQTMIF